MRSIGSDRIGRAGHLSLPTTASAAPVVFEAAGATANDIQAAVGDFRDFLGP